MLPSAWTTHWSTKRNCSRAAEDYGMLKSELEEVHERRPTLVTRYLTMRHRAYLDMMQTIIYQYAQGR